AGRRRTDRVPVAMIIVDPKRAHTAVKGARRVGVATVALIDTDSDPDTVDLAIPGNDDSIRSIELVLAKLADAVLEGRAALPPEQQTVVKPRSAPIGNGSNNPVLSPKPTPAVAE